MKLVMKKDRILLKVLVIKVVDLAQDYAWSNGILFAIIKIQYKAKLKYL